MCICIFTYIDGHDISNCAAFEASCTLCQKVACSMTPGTWHHLGIFKSAGCPCRHVEIRYFQVVQEAHLGFLPKECFILGTLDVDGALIFLSCCAARKTIDSWCRNPILTLPLKKPCFSREFPHNWDILGPFRGCFILLGWDHSKLWLHSFV